MIFFDRRVLINNVYFIPMCKRSIICLLSTGVFVKIRRSSFDCRRESYNFFPVFGGVLFFNALRGEVSETRK